MSKIKRISVPVSKSQSDSGIRRLYPVEAASWLWHPHQVAGETAFLRFENRFRLKTKQEFVCHVSADQRYELFLDGAFIAIGPDRSDLRHWSFASYRICLEPGEHTLTADVWWLQEPPAAQLTWRGGFIFAAEGPLSSILDTGSGNWTVTDLTDAWLFEDHPYEMQKMVGKAQTIIGERLLSEEAEAAAPEVVMPPVEYNQWGGIRPGWCLYPSDLPDQLSREVIPGGFIAVVPGGLGGEDPLEDTHFISAAAADFNRLIHDGLPLTIPPDTTLSALWDLGDYFCGYSQADLSGAAGASVSMLWAEAPFVHPVSQVSKHKGVRRELAGKYLHGLTDTFACHPKRRHAFRPCWFRSGNYILITICTAGEPLTVHSLSIRETRYPLETESEFEADDPSLPAIVGLMTRSMQMCCHETYYDCPHYEQLMYVGDTRLLMLIASAMSRDSRLTKRGIRMLDWSRLLYGLVNAGYPLGPAVISTFPLYWILMVHDYLYWHDDIDLVREMLPGVRDTVNRMCEFRNSDGLLENLPGWMFVDTVPEWAGTIYGPSNETGPSAIINLLFAYVLKKAGEIEAAAGEPEPARFCERLAAATAEAAVATFWDPGLSLFADDAAKSAYSEHAQVAALLADFLPENQANACFAAMLSCRERAAGSSMPRPAECQTFWLFYLFEVFHKMDRGDLILQGLKQWRDWLADGFRTAPEMFEPSRSDCHGWGAHPLFHFHAGIAGIRPDAPGFSRVRIAPSPGALSAIRSRFPHPRGWIETRMQFTDGENLSASVTLPDEVRGTFAWQGREVELRPGAQDIAMP